MADSIYQPNVQINKIEITSSSEANVATFLIVKCCVTIFLSAVRKINNMFTPANHKKQNEKPVLNYWNLC